MTLHHVSYGDGVPVLALHGWTPDHRLMTGCLEPIFAELPGYRRLYPDLPGMGQSPAGDIDSSDGIQAAVRAFIDEQIGTEPFILIGESYGGYLVARVGRGATGADSRPRPDLPGRQAGPQRADRARTRRPAHRAGRRSSR